MTSSEKLCLKWNDFQETVLSSFKDLRHDKDFTDVTLACEDGKQLAVHKVVLSSVSPLFMSLLKSNKHQHPLLYMRGIKSEDLVAIIDFLYLGEANVHQDNLDSFLSVANELKLKGLTGELEQQLQRTKLSKTDLSFIKGDRIVSVLGDSDNLDEQINSMLDATENFSREKMGKDLRRSFVKFVERKQNKQI